MKLNEGCADGGGRVRIACLTQNDLKEDAKSRSSLIFAFVSTRAIDGH